MCESNISSHRATASLIKSGSVKVAHVTGFLPEQEKEALFTGLCAEQEAFQAHGQVESTRFLSIEWDGKSNTKADWIQVAAKKLTKRIIEQIPPLCKMLDIKPFKASNVNITFVNGLQGHSADIHADTTNGQCQMSILYYFHKTPKVFRGGDLNFYAFDEGSPNGFSEEVLFQIEQKDNLLIAFPSQTFHGVTEVQCDSADFGDGRFAAVMFLGA